MGWVKGVLACYGEGGMGAGRGSEDGGFYYVLVEDNETKDASVQAHDEYEPL